MNYLEALNYGNSLLKSNNIDSYSLDTELLLSAVLKNTREMVLINLQKKLDNKKFKYYKKLVLRRKNKEPIAHILNKKEFWRYTFKVNKEVLIPRPETEIIVHEVLKLTNLNSSKHILDVGTGSGCILQSILNERPKCTGTAIDISKKALNIAISNAKMHHLENKIKFVNIDIDKFNHNKYDFIVSNPPYINKVNLKRLDDNVKLFEPVIALSAGIDGLSETKKLIIKSNKLLKINGKLIFEIESTQKKNVVQLLRKNNFYVHRICKDFQLYPRVIVSSKLM